MQPVDRLSEFAGLNPDGAVIVVGSPLKLTLYRLP
jgi:hypothetical protein